jgi:hypothetical protein
MWWLRSRRQRLAAGVLLVFVVVVGLVAYDRVSHEEPAPSFQSDEDHFLYGSVGTEAEGIPYWIWLVLPRIFPEYLRPGGYASIGLLSRDGHEMPIGLSKVTVGVPRVGINCAMCHAAHFRATADDVPTIYPAAASPQDGARAYLRFLMACANDQRFTARTILGEIAKNTRLSFVDRVLYRIAIIPATRRRILRLRDNHPFDHVTLTVAKQIHEAASGDSDVMPLWALRRRDGTAFFRDGLNTSLREAVLSSALSDGATKKWLDGDAGNWNRTEPKATSSLHRVMNYIGELKPPKYPFPIDGRLAAAGALTYDSMCASCHKAGEARAQSIIPLAEIGTDPHRLDRWTADAANASNAWGRGHAWKFSNFRKTAGYMAVPLDGVWLTAPYLHNGSVPTIADLLEPVASRPGKFWRGYDLYDAEQLGYVARGAEAERAGTPFDVTGPGNSNAGHLYGTALPPEQKRALLEYLKTL